MRIPVSPSAAVPAVLALTLMLAGPSFAQQSPGWDWPDKAKNLKVLPKDTSKDQLRETMMVFTRSLGVRCTECHVGEEGKPLSTFDFASDKNPKKGVARDMMKMVGDVRADLKKMDLQGPHRVAMGCVTCHHGRPTPATLVEELGWTYETSGIDSTLASYQALRTRYYGRNAYDFGDGSLVELGTNLSDKGKHDDAIRVMMLNVEQYPNSARAQDGLAEAYAAAGQKDKAIEAFKKALTLEPKDRMADHRIKELEGGSK
jgi:tetratricopeptide (TPR) repeat protein